MGRGFARAPGLVARRNYPIRGISDALVTRAPASPRPFLRRRGEPVKTEARGQRGLERPGRAAHGDARGRRSLSARACLHPPGAQDAGTTKVAAMRHGSHHKFKGSAEPITRYAPKSRRLPSSSDFEPRSVGVEQDKKGRFEIELVLKRLARARPHRLQARTAIGALPGLHAASFTATASRWSTSRARGCPARTAPTFAWSSTRIDLCYSKSHIDTFVVITGDSDFSPLVSKLARTTSASSAAACAARRRTCSPTTATSSSSTTT